MATVNLRDKYRETMVALTGGPFEGRVIEAEAGQSSNQNPQIKFKLQIEGGPNHGKTFPDNATLSDAAADFFFRKMAALGLGASWFNVPDNEEPPGLEATAREMVGRPCRFMLAKDTYNGRERSKVSEILPAAEGAKRIMPSGSSNGTPGTPSGVPSGVPNVPAPAPTPTPPATPAPELKLPDETDAPF